MDFARIDLNLLVSLDALLSECNVTKAAARLHVSQPALSAQLGRLRQLFHDPLLLPSQTGRGMTATARALTLQGPLRSALRNLDSVIRSAPTFDPFTNARTFKVAISDNATSVIGLPLIARLATNAGDNVRVAFSVTDEERIATHMEEAEIDLVIDADRVVPQGLSSQPLIEEPFVMAQRKAHPRGTDTLDLNAYCALRHVVVTPERNNLRGYMDAYLQSHGRQRNAVLFVPQVMMVPEILRTSDYVCTLPRMLMLPFASIVDVFELPFQTDNYKLAMGWHPRNHEDPAAKWLRGQVLALFHESPDTPDATSPAIL